MNRDHLARLGAPITRPPGRLPRLGGKRNHDHGKAALTSKREATHKGHAIVIMTAYSITVDDKPLSANVEVDALGRVHCHGLPNYNFLSAIDMVKAVIDSEPATFPKRGGGHANHGGGGH